jgi:hypothetical protein
MALAAAGAAFAGLGFSPAVAVPGLLAAAEAPVPWGCTALLLPCTAGVTFVLRPDIPAAPFKLWTEVLSAVAPGFVAGALAGLVAVFAAEEADTAILEVVGPPTAGSGFEPAAPALVGRGTPLETAPPPALDGAACLARAGLPGALTRAIAAVAGLEAVTAAVALAADVVLTGGLTGFAPAAVVAALGNASTVAGLLAVLVLPDAVAGRDRTAADVPAPVLAGTGEVPVIAEVPAAARLCCAGPVWYNGY